MKGLIVLLVGSWATWGAAAPMGDAAARHLLERTGFGAPPAQVAEYARLDRQQGVDRLLNGRFSPQSDPPAVAYERRVKFKILSDDEKRQMRQEMFQQGADLRAWWAGEMLRAPTPQDALRERMTLFWHNHFVSSQQKVKSGALMLQQNELLRRHALGNLAILLHAVSKDPAMIIYLDGANNRKGNPNENFAREVMELFTLGEGHYGEPDIKEAARAFTGWSIDPDNGQFTWRPANHDFGEKVVLGRRGDFDGDAVLDILLAQPATAAFIAGKLWREFVSPTPEPEEIKRVAAALRGAGYEIRPALRLLLLSDAFWTPENRGALTKAPVDFVIGSLRTLAVEAPDALPVALALRNLGQDLFAPPNVRGWPGGDAWINSSTLLARKQFVERLMRATEMDGRAMRQTMKADVKGEGLGRLGPEGKARALDAMAQMHFDAPGWLARYRSASALQTAVLALPPVQMPADGAPSTAMLHSLLLDPVFQLK